MKILIYTDVHWSTYSSIIRKRGDVYSVRLEHLIDSMNWVESLGSSLNCDLEICAGDFMDKAELTAEEITALREVKWNNIQKRFIVGNHDSNVESLQFNTVEALNKENTKILCDITEENFDNCDILYLPYSRNYDMLNSRILEFGKKASNNKFIFSHAELKGVSYGRIESMTGIDTSILEKSCNMLFNGHLHEGGMINKHAINIGSLSAHNFTNDSFKHDYGVYVLDTETRSIDFIENPYAFNFYKIRFENKNDLKKLDGLKNNSILSIVCNNDLKQAIENKIKATKNISDYRLAVFYTSQTSEGDSYNFKVEDHIEQFINFAREKFEQSPILEEELLRLKS